MPEPTEELAELWWNYKKHLVSAREINGKPGVIILPDGALLDRSQLMLSYETYKNPCPRVIGTNDDFEVWGQLPVLPVINVKMEE